MLCYVAYILLKNFIFWIFQSLQSLTVSKLLLKEKIKILNLFSGGPARKLAKAVQEAANQASSVNFDPVLFSERI